MTPTEDMARMTERLVAEALATLRAEADRQEWVNRVYTVPQVAVEAAKAARERLQAMDDSPEMPSASRDAKDIGSWLHAFCDAAEAARAARLRLAWTDAA